MTSPRLVPYVELLSRRARGGMILGLDRVLGALSNLGNPHLAVPFVHVTGTNGKGSTSAMVASIMCASGLRTGLYTSPHLCRWSERIRIDGEPVSDDFLAEVLERTIAAAPEDVTFFETLTIAAFVAFAQLGVDVAVLEVGIGGRLDATNVIPRPLATAITSVDFDHTVILGSTLASIAREKAGIFKPDVPVVLGPLGEEATRAVMEVAHDVGASPIVVVGDESGDGRIRVGLQGGEVEIGLPSGRLVKSRLSLSGSYQAANAAVAVGLAEFAAATFPQLLPAIEKGLSTTEWPGRLEQLERDGKSVLLDCAHNPHGAAGLLAYVRARGWSPDRVVLVFGALADKSWTTMLDMLGPLANRRVYSAPKGRAPAPLEELAKRLPGKTVTEPREAIHRALEWADAGDVVIVAGSIFLVAEARAELFGLECDPVVAL